MSSSRAAVAEKIKNASRILISSHVGADGDSIGSSLALLLALERTGKYVRYVNGEPLPEDFSFLSGFEKLTIPIEDDESFDLGIVLDTSAIDRVGSAWKYFESLERVVIDHHTMQSGNLAADLIWCEPDAAAVTVLITELFDDLGVGLDEELATPLYVGLFTDTGSFAQGNADARAFGCASRLVAAGASPFDVAKRLNESRSLESVRLVGLAASRIRREDGIAWTWLEESDYEKVGASEDDTEGLSGTLRSVGDIRVAASFRGRSAGGVKVTFRAKDDTDVAEVAREFGGGGHAAAAGCTVEMPMDKAQEVVLERLKKELRRNK